MATTAYNRNALALLAVSVLACVAAWSGADALYVRSSRVFGWALGLLGSGIPAFTVGAYLLWLRRQRGLGHPAAQVAWLPSMFVITAILFAGMLLFSLM